MRSRKARSVWPLLLPFFLAGCAVAGIGAPVDDDPGKDDQPADPLPDGGLPPMPPSEDSRAVLDVHALDLWAQPLPQGAEVRVTRNGASVPATGFPVARVPLRDAGEYQIEVSAPYHEPLKITVKFDGTGNVSGARVPGDPVPGVLLSHGVVEVSAKRLPAHLLFVGLRHRFFAASGPPARRGNAVDLLMDGEEAWAGIDAALRAAKKTIHIAAWWLEPELVLARDAAGAGRPLLGILDASPALKRVLLSQFYGQDGVLSWFSTASPLFERANAKGDRFEFMGQANLSSGAFTVRARKVSFATRVRSASAAWKDLAFESDPLLAPVFPEREVDLTAWPVEADIEHASWHQSFFVIDDEVAFVTGMGAGLGDWDSSAHAVTDARRPDGGPRKDYTLRLRGPAVADVQRVFADRWQLALDEQVEYSWNATPAAAGAGGGTTPGAAAVQVTTTMPDPHADNSILESWLNAVGQATRYIYIEDRYLRAPVLNEAIVRRMGAVPGLKLVIVSSPVGEWADPGCFWTATSHAQLRAAFPSRTMTLRLRAFATSVGFGIDETDASFVDIDTNSKMLIVDDVFLSAGSANVNHRGLLYEGELNLAVVDASWVGAVRKRIVTNLLGVPAADDVAAWWKQLEDARAWNDAVYERWSGDWWDLDLDGDPLPADHQPRGFIYGLEVGPPGDCLIEDIGPDLL